MAAVTSSAASATAKSAKAKKGAEQRLKQVQKAAILLKQVATDALAGDSDGLSEGEKHVLVRCMT